uniref:Toll-like receptor 3-like n=1 Tax=Saccoglossus kowalevskii TaxID=10224 RepID=A0ABM0MUF7_SACKO|nr:PREDICTED: toll-like receptor 3-like [Saccoglossus kowalevskii]
MYRLLLLLSAAILNTAGCRGNIMCHCDYKNMLLVDCGGNSLTSVPDDVPNKESLTSLWLDKNNFRCVQQDMFKGFQKLRNLWLDSSNVHELEVRAFWEIKGLHQLYLRDNNILNIDEDNFSGLEQLTSLDLRNNPVQSIQNSAFKDLVNLNALNFSDCNLTTLHSGILRGLTKLEVLKFERCNISAIMNETFDALINLKILSLHGNQLRNIDGKLFHSLTIQTLDVSCNLLRGAIGNLCNNVQSVERLNYEKNLFTTIKFDESYSKCRNLTYLNIANVANSISVMGNTFQGLKTINITELDFHGNKMKDLDPDALTSFENPILLNLGSTNIRTDFTRTFETLLTKNKLKTHSLLLNDISHLSNILLQSHHNIVQNVWLRDLDLSDNQIPRLVERMFQWCPLIKKLNLMSNSITNVAVNTFLGLEYLTELDLSDNYIWNIKADTFKNSQLIELNLSNNILVFVGFEGLKKLKKLKLSDQGKVRIVKEQFIKLESLEELDISYNFWGSSFQLPLCNLTSLKKLNISMTTIENDMRNFSIDDMSETCSTFVSELTHLDFSMSYVDNMHQIERYFYKNRKALINLKTLNISSLLHAESYKYFPWNIFTELINLKELQLQNNHIGNHLLPRSDPFSKLTNLQTLDASGNRITNIAAWKGLLNIQKLGLHDNWFDVVETETFSDMKNLESLYLHGSQFDCGCTIDRFHRFLKKHTTIWTSEAAAYDGRPFWFQNYNCSEPKMTYVIDAYSSPWKCDKILIVLVTFAIITACMGLSFLLYKFCRYEIRYIWFVVRLKLNCVRHAEHTNLINLDEYDYDVHISYNITDENWVIDHLLPFLENHLQIRVHINDRDMRGGVNRLSYASNLILKRTRKIMFVLSDNFVQDKYCMLELQLAFEKLFNDHENIMVFANLERINKNLQPLMLRLPICKKRQNKWYRYNEITRDAFWNDLKESIAENGSVNHTVQLL